MPLSGVEVNWIGEYRMERGCVLYKMKSVGVQGEEMSIFWAGSFLLLYIVLRS